MHVLVSTRHGPTARRRTLNTDNTGDGLCRYQDADATEAAFDARRRRSHVEEYRCVPRPGKAGTQPLWAPLIVK